METYQNSVTGTKIEVFQTGKSFKTIETAPATKHSGPYEQERKHRAYSGVLALISKRHNLVRSDS